MTLHPTINVKSATSDDIVSQIRYLPPDKSSKYLGHYKDLMGNQKEQALRFKQIIQEETAFLQTCHLSRFHVHKYHTTIFSKKLRILCQPRFSPRNIFANFNAHIIMHCSKAQDSIKGRQFKYVMVLPILQALVFFVFIWNKEAYVLRFTLKANRWMIPLEL